MHVITVGLLHNTFILLSNKKLSESTGQLRSEAKLTQSYVAAKLIYYNKYDGSATLFRGQRQHYTKEIIL